MKRTKGGFLKDMSHLADVIGARYWPGYVGAFTRDEYPHAKFRNGQRVRKVDSDDKTDTHPSGTLGTVLGSIGHPDVGAAYFVEFDRSPGHATMIVEKKLEAAE